MKHRIRLIRALAAAPLLASLFAGAPGAAHAQTPPVRAQVVCHGDSLTRGENASSGLGTATGTTYPGGACSNAWPRLARHERRDGRMDVQSC